MRSLKLPGGILVSLMLIPVVYSQYTPGFNGGTDYVMLNGTDFPPPWTLEVRTNKNEIDNYQHLLTSTDGNSGRLIRRVLTSVPLYCKLAPLSGPVSNHELTGRNQNLILRPMKKITSIMFCALFTASLAFSQTTDKEIKKELKDKASAEAKKEAKSLSKQGWKTMPGELPMEKMIENAWMKQVAEDEEGNPKYIKADGNAVAESKTVAEAQALEFSKLQLAGMIETKVASIVNGNLANQQLSTEDAASVTELVQSSKNVIAQELGYIDPAFKLYRDLKDQKIEVQMRIFYETKQSMAVAKKAIRRDLKDKLKKTDEEVDQLLKETRW